MKHLLVASIACAICTFSYSSHADSNSISVLLTNAKVESASLDNGFKLQYQHYFSDNIAVELAHAKYGSYSYDDWWGNESVSVDVSGINIGIVARSQIADTAYLFGKLGISHWKFDESGTSLDANDNDAFAGFGFNFDVSNSAILTVEYEFLKTGDSKTKSLNAGIGIKF